MVRYTYVLTQSLYLEVKIFEAKMCFFPMLWPIYLLAHIRTFFGKSFRKFYFFIKSSEKFAVKITHFYFSHSYCKASLKKMIANLKRRHNLKHDPRITLVEVLRASKTYTFS